MIDGEIGAPREISFLVVGWIGIVPVFVQPVLQYANLEDRDVRRDERARGELTLSFGRFARRFFSFDADELFRLMFVVVDEEDDDDDDDDDDDRIEFDELSRSQSESVCSLTRLRSF